MQPFWLSMMQKQIRGTVFGGMQPAHRHPADPRPLQGGPVPARPARHQGVPARAGQRRIRRHARRHQHPRAHPLRRGRLLTRATQKKFSMKRSSTHPRRGGRARRSSPDADPAVPPTPTPTSPRRSLPAPPSAASAPDNRPPASRSGSARSRRCPVGIDFSSSPEDRQGLLRLCQRQRRHQRPPHRLRHRRRRPRPAEGIGARHEVRRRPVRRRDDRRCLVRRVRGQPADLREGEPVRHPRCRSPAGVLLLEEHVGGQRRPSPVRGLGDPAAGQGFRHQERRRHRLFDPGPGGVGQGGHGGLCRAERDRAHVLRPRASPGPRRHEPRDEPALPTAGRDSSRGGARRTTPHTSKPSSNRRWATR